MTFLDAEVAGPDRVRVGALELTCADAGRFAPGTPVRLGMRPEEVRVRNIDAGDAERDSTRTVAALDFLGAFCRAQLKPDGAPGRHASLADFSANADARSRGRARARR